MARAASTRLGLTRLGLTTAGWLTGLAVAVVGAVHPAWGVEPPPPYPAAPALPASSPAPSSAPPTSSAPAPTTAAPAQGDENDDGVLVVVRSDNPSVRLDRAEEANHPAEEQCTTPCRVVLPRGHQYMITGPGIQSSSRFELPDDRDRLTLDVKAGSSRARAGAIALLLTGGALAVIGYVSGLGSPLQGFNGVDPQPNSSRSHDYEIGFLIVGVALEAAGVIGILLTRTVVTTDKGTTFSEQPPRRPGKQPRLTLTPRGLAF